MSPSSPAGSSSSLSSYNPNATLLALPDGIIPSSHPDQNSHCTSLIGGYPTFPPTTQPPKELNCGVCHLPIPLLTQVYCPLEGGENDRTVYVWACWRSACQRREGSVRAFRASVRNDEYVRDVEEKKALAEKAAAEERERARVNPFTIGDAAPAGSNLFGNAEPLFGANPFSSNPFAAPQTPSSNSKPTDLLTSTEPPSLSSLSLGPSTSTTLQPPLPAYQPAQYLTTIDEYIPPLEIESDSDSDEEEIEHTEEEKAMWKDEKWEKVLPKGVDEIFESFVRRLEGAEGGRKQVLRYDFDGVPLPYSNQSPLFKSLFPTYKFSPTTTQSADEDEDPLYPFYAPHPIIPKCNTCNSDRVFELQLVPSLISLLKPETLSVTGERRVGRVKSEEERKRELERLARKLAGEGGEGSGGKGDGKQEEEEEEEGEMEWGTVMVFGCKSDCVGLSEEWVGVEWESTV